jgi:hypothetical protein
MRWQRWNTLTLLTPLTDVEELESNGKVANAKRQIKQTSAKCQAARIALEKHNAEHQCLDEHFD